MFRLEELLRHRPDIPQDRCVVDKMCYRTKAEAQAVLRRVNRRHAQAMQAFRCRYGDHYHLGRRR